MVAAPIGAVQGLAVTGGEDAIYQPVIVAPVVYCLVGLTVGPLAEEMLYRGVLYGSLRRWVRPVPAVVLQAIVFAVMHRYGWGYMAIAWGRG